MPTPRHSSTVTRLRRLVGTVVTVVIVATGGAQSSNIIEGESESNCYPAVTVAANRIVHFTICVFLLCTMIYSKKRKDNSNPLSFNITFSLCLLTLLIYIQIYFIKQRAIHHAYFCVFSQRGVATRNFSSRRSCQHE